MKISLNWLRQFIHIEESPEEIAALLTGSGLEVEGLEVVEPVPGGLQGVVIGEVLRCEKHPNADKLSLTLVDLGDSQTQIVCGAPNVAAGQKVLVAKVGTTIYPTSGEPIKLKKAKIRGEVSEGMICAEDELGLGNSHAGIMVLNTELPNGTPAAQYLKLESDVVFEIGLTPNRADAASHLGVARDLRALLNRQLCLPTVENLSGGKTSTHIEVEVAETSGCLRYSGLLIEGVNVGPSPEWLQKRLRVLGLEPINNVVDATNYILHDLGQPLHAFDAAKIGGKKIVVRTLEQNTPFTTLDEKERKLQAQDLMICDAEGRGLCIAGVFGGQSSGVSESTQSVFLESAYFSPDWIRRTAQHHGLKTDASFRYERGTDPNITVYALKRAAQLIQEIAGGTIDSQLIDIYPQPVEDFRVKADFGRMQRLIGAEIPQEEMIRILESLEIRVQDVEGTQFTALVPPYRVDVQREADLVEEVIRIYGFDRIPVSENLQASYLASFPSPDPEVLQKKIAQSLVANGFYEIVTNSLTSPRYAQEAGFLNEQENVEILNKLSEELGVMRQSLLFSGLESIAHNINRRQTDLKFFEFGKTYHTRGGKYVEQNWLGLWMTGNAESEHYLRPAQPVGYADLRLQVEKVLYALGIRQYDMRVVHEKEFAYAAEIVYTAENLQKQNGRVSAESTVLVRFGKVAPKLARLADVKQEVFWAEFNWPLVLKLNARQKLEFSPIARFPEVRRDLSLVLDRSVEFEQIRQLVSRLERRLIRRIGVFDVYEGERIEKDKKAYALSFILQDNEKTLTDKVIDKVMQNLMAAFEKELGAVIRK